MVARYLEQRQFFMTVAGFFAIDAIVVRRNNGIFRLGVPSESVFVSLLPPGE